MENLIRLFAILWIIIIWVGLFTVYLVRMLTPKGRKLIELDKDYALKRRQLYLDYKLTKQVINRENEKNLDDIPLH